MTTEIAVINRIGVALATDSAVTISGDGKSKVFDTGDKLFELCHKKSIGVMINGNMDILGVPWEIIIKDFREAERPSTSRSMKDWVQELLDFIKTHKTHSDVAERRFISALAIEEFSSVKASVSRQLFNPSDPNAQLDVVGLIERAAKSRIELYAKHGVAESLANLSKDEVRKKYAKLLNEIITQQFAPVEISAGKKMILRKLAVEAMFSGNPSDFSTGVIVAGFADGDMFPSIAMVEVDGSVAGILKYTHGEHFQVDRTKNTGRVISFAQTDVVERILSGVDIRFIRKSTEWIKQTLGGVKDSVVAAIKAGGASDADANAVFQDITNAMAEDYRGPFAKAAKAEFEQDFNGIVSLRPKPNVIELAEALVSITAIERKASSDMATVGGPVDVAFITKHEGFVWIKRKHYFDPALNPHFFWRKFGRHDLSGGPNEQPAQ